MNPLENYIRCIPDFPNPGVMFRDVSTITQNPEGLRLSITELEKLLEGVEYDVIAGAEARGFLFGMPLAYNAHKAFVMIRKKGKLPYKTVSQEYDLEYGTAEIEMHQDSILPGQKVVLLDDLIATGGTLAAAAKLVERLGGEVVKIIAIIELQGLHGRDALAGYDVDTVIQYPGI